jgi:hypothetical protein
MRVFASAALVSAGLLVAACGSSNSSNPASPTAAVSAQQATSNVVRGIAATSPGNGNVNNGNGKPDIDPTWANGQTVYMIGPHLIADAIDNQPNLYAQAEELYLAVFPQATMPTLLSGPITLPGGYRPQCNPCFHPGLPLPFVYHDHIISGAPGHGNDGTAGEFKGPWKVMVVLYDYGWTQSPAFHPLTSQADLDAAEAAGGMFDGHMVLQHKPAGAPGPNPFEIETGNVLICPIVSNKA